MKKCLVLVLISCGLLHIHADTVDSEDLEDIEGHYPEVIEIYTQTNKYPDHIEIASSTHVNNASNEIKFKDRDLTTRNSSKRKHHHAVLNERGYVSPNSKRLQHTSTETINNNKDDESLEDNKKFYNVELKFHRDLNNRKDGFSKNEEFDDDISLVQLHKEKDTRDRKSQYEKVTEEMNYEIEKNKEKPCIPCQKKLSIDDYHAKKWNHHKKKENEKKRELKKGEQIYNFSDALGDKGIKMKIRITRSYTTPRPLPEEYLKYSVHPYANNRIVTNQREILDVHTISQRDVLQYDETKVHEPTIFESDILLSPSAQSKNQNHTVSKRNVELDDKKQKKPKQNENDLLSLLIFNKAFSNPKPKNTKRDLASVDSKDKENTRQEQKEITKLENETNSKNSGSKKNTTNFLGTAELEGKQQHNIKTPPQENNLTSNSTDSKPLVDTSTNKETENPISTDQQKPTTRNIYATVETKDSHELLLNYQNKNTSQEKIDPLTREPNNIHFHEATHSKIHNEFHETRTNAPNTTESEQNLKFLNTAMSTSAPKLSQKKHHNCNDNHNHVNKTTESEQNLKFLNTTMSTSASKLSQKKHHNCNNNHNHVNKHAVEYTNHTNTLQIPGNYTPKQYLEALRAFIKLQKTYAENFGSISNETSPIVSKLENEESKSRRKGKRIKEIKITNEDGDEIIIKPPLSKEEVDDKTNIGNILKNHVEPLKKTLEEPIKKLFDIKSQSNLDDGIFNITYNPSTHNLKYNLTETEPKLILLTEKTYTDHINPFTKTEKTYTDNINPFTKSVETYTDNNNSFIKSETTYTANINPFTTSETTYTDNINPFTTGETTYTDNNNSFTKNETTFTDNYYPFTKSETTSTANINPFTNSEKSYTDNKNPFTKREKAYTDNINPFTKSVETYTDNNNLFTISEKIQQNDMLVNKENIKVGQETLAETFTTTIKTKQISGISTISPTANTTLTDMESDFNLQNRINTSESKSLEDKTDISVFESTTAPTTITESTTSNEVTKQTGTTKHKIYPKQPHTVSVEKVVTVTPKEKLYTNQNKTAAQLCTTDMQGNLSDMTILNKVTYFDGNGNLLAKLQYTSNGDSLGIIKEVLVIECNKTIKSNNKSEEVLNISKKEYIVEDYFDLDNITEKVTEASNETVEINNSITVTINSNEEKILINDKTSKLNSYHEEEEKIKLNVPSKPCNHTGTLYKREDLSTLNDTTSYTKCSNTTKCKHEKKQETNKTTSKEHNKNSLAQYDKTVESKNTSTAATPSQDTTTTPDNTTINCEKHKCQHNEHKKISSTQAPDNASIDYEELRRIRVLDEIKRLTYDLVDKSLELFSAKENNDTIIKVRRNNEANTTQKQPDDNQKLDIATEHQPPTPKAKADPSNIINDTNNSDKATVVNASIDVKTEETKIDKRNVKAPVSNFYNPIPNHAIISQMIENATKIFNISLEKGVPNNLSETTMQKASPNPMVTKVLTKRKSKPVVNISITNNEQEIRTKRNHEEIIHSETNDYMLADNNQTTNIDNNSSVEKYFLSLNQTKLTKHFIETSNEAKKLDKIYTFNEPTTKRTNEQNMNQEHDHKSHIRKRNALFNQLLYEKEYSLKKILTRSLFPDRPRFKRSIMANPTKKVDSSSEEDSALKLLPRRQLPDIHHEIKKRSPLLLKDTSNPNLDIRRQLIQSSPCTQFMVIKTTPKSTPLSLNMIKPTKSHFQLKNKSDMKRSNFYNPLSNKKKYFR